MFVDDHRLLTVEGQTLARMDLLEPGGLEPILEAFAVQGIVAAAENGLVLALERDEQNHIVQYVLLDRRTERLLERHPAYSAEGTFQVPSSYIPERPLESGATDRVPELSRDGGTVLWWTGEDAVEVHAAGRTLLRINGLGLLDAAHLGPEGRLLAVSRGAEVTVLDTRTGDLRFRARGAPEFGATGFAVREGVVVLNSSDRLRYPMRRAWRRWSLPPGSPPIEPAAPLGEGYIQEDDVHVYFDLSEDGRRLVLTRDGGDTTGARVVDLEAEQPIHLAPDCPDPAAGPGWIPFSVLAGGRPTHSPNGERVAFPHGYAQTQLVELGWPT